jgi:hypothetical protein
MLPFDLGQSLGRCDLGLRFRLADLSTRSLLCQGCFCACS